MVCSIPLRSSRARRCAASCVMPCATYSSVFRSRWSRSSSSNSWSACAQRNNDRSRSGIVNSQCSGCISGPPSLVPESDHGINAHGAARGQIARGKPRKDNYYRCEDQHPYAVEMEVLKFRRSELWQLERNENSDPRANTNEPHAFANHQAQHSGRLRTQGQANPHFLRALFNQIRHHPEDSDCCHQQPEKGKDPNDPPIPSPPAPELLIT